MIELDPGLDEDAALAVADRVAAKLRTIDAPEVLVGGKLLAERTFAEQATEDAVRGEAIALVVLAVVLVLFGGGLVAGALPLLAALATIAGSLLVLNVLARATAVSEFAVNVVTLLGLGLAVDYSLLVLARFREERAADAGRAAAGPAGADDRGRRPRGARLRAGGRARARGALRLRRPAALRDGAGRRAGGRHGDGRRPHARARAGRGRAQPHPGARHAHVGLAARAPSAPGLLARLAAFAQRRPARWWRWP